MPNSDHTRSQYLKALLEASKNNRANEGVLVNPSNTLGNANTDIDGLAVLDTQLPRKVSTPTIETEDTRSRNWWQRTIDTVDEFRSNIFEGLVNWVGGIVDATLWVGGAVGNAFGADTQWAKDAMAYDWEAQFLNFTNQTQLHKALYSGDIFTADYWQNWADIGSAEESRKNIDQMHASSFTSEMRGGQGVYEDITKGIGYILPSIALATVSGGASAGAQAVTLSSQATAGISLGATGVSAFGSGTQEALQDGANYYQAGAAGAVSGAIEVGTEALSFGVGKLVGKILGKTVSYGTRIGGAQFAKAITKTTVGELGKAALEEGTEELISELLSPFAKATYKGTDAFKEYADPELYKQAVIAFAGGAVGGLFGGGIQNIQANRTYSKQGVEILGLVEDIAQMKQDNESEFKKGNKADQSAITVVEERLGEKVKELTSKLDKLSQSNPEAFKRVMEAIRNPQQIMKQLEALEKETGKQFTPEEKAKFRQEYIGTPQKLAERLGQSTIESIAEQDSLSLTNKLKTPTIIKIAKKGDFEMGNKARASSEAFIDTDSKGRNIVWINPKYASRYYKIVAHEAVSHGVIDTNETSQNKVFNIIENDSKLSKEFASKDTSILKLYEDEIKAELRRKYVRVSQKVFDEHAKETKLFKSEKITALVENIVHDEKSLKRLLDTKASRSEMSGLKALLSRIKNALSPSKDAKLIKKIQNVLDEITASQKETTGELKLAYSKTEKSAKNIKNSSQNESNEIKSNYGKETNYRRFESNDDEIKKLLRKDSLGRYGQKPTRLREIFNYERANSRDFVRLGLIETSRGYYLERVSKNTFYKYFQEIHKSFDLAERVIVDLHSIDDYDTSKGHSFIGVNGLSVGFVENNGNIISVANSNKSGIKGFTHDFLPWAIKNGGLYMDSMYSQKESVENLPFAYSKHGFEPIAKIKYNREIMLESHTVEEVNAFEMKYGESDIIFSVYVGENAPVFENVAQLRESIANLPYSEWSEAEKIRDSKLAELKNPKVKLSTKQQEFFKDSKVRDENGNLKVVYHGTLKNFNVFEKNVSQNAFFFTDNETNALSYTDMLRKLIVKKVYLNITNPYVVDGKNNMWNKIDLGKTKTQYITTWGKVKENLLNGKLNNISQLDDIISSIDQFDAHEGFNQSIQYQLDQGKTAEEIRQHLFSKESIQRDVIEYFEEMGTEDGDTIVFNEAIPFSHDKTKKTNDYQDTRSVVDYVLEENKKLPKGKKYDGIVFNNIVDFGANSLKQMLDIANVYVAFEPNQIKSVDNDNPTDSADIRYSRTFESVQESKDYAQHMQERVIHATTAREIYDIMVDGISSAFSVDIKFEKIAKRAEETTIAFNTLLNKPVELNKVVNGIINDILDSKIEYQVAEGENAIASTLKATLREHLSNLGIDVNDFFNESVEILKDILLDKSNDSKVQKLRNYYQTKIAVLAKLINQYRNNSYYIVKSFQVLRKINEKFEKNSLPRQVGDRHVAELEFYHQATKGIKVSRSAKGISPLSIDKIIAGLRTYSPEITKQLKWLQFNQEIYDSVNFLMAQQVNGKFPNRALTLEENIAVYTIMTNIAADMKSLASEKMAERHKATERADLEAKIIAAANVGIKSNLVQRELDVASSPDTIIGRNFGRTSSTYDILYAQMYKAYDKQLLKQWEFLGEYDKLKKEYQIKDYQLAKRVDFKGEKLSFDLLLDIYIQSRTPSGLATLQQGGYSIYNKGNTTHLLLTPEDINMLDMLIPDNMRIFGEKVLSDLYNGSIQRYKGDTDERIFGFKNLINEIYYPSTKSDTSNIKFDSENEFKALDPSKTTFNQERLNATKLSLRGMGFSERFKVYTNAITKYGEMTEATQVFQSLTNQFTTRADGTSTPRLTVMAEAIPHFREYINYLQNQMSGNAVDKTKTRSKMFTNMVSFTLAGNLSVVLKQTASIPSIMFEVKFTSWLKAMAGAAGKIATYQKSKAHLKQMSGILAERWGDYNILKSKVLSENLSQIAKFFGVPMAKMDEAVIVVFAYSAAQHEAESLGYGKVGTKSNETAAIDILNRIVANTQSNAIPMKMSMNRAGANGFLRKALSYFSSDLQNKVSQINMLLSEALNAKKQLAVIEQKIAETELAIKENEAKFEEFKKANNITEVSENAIAKLDEENAKKFTYFEQEVERLQNQKVTLSEVKTEKQTIISGGKNAREALKLLVSLFLSGLMIAGIEQFMARILGRKGWNEDTSSEFALSLLLESTVNNLPYVSTITNAMQYGSDVGGYDFTLINNMIDIVSDITNMAQSGKWELNTILLYLGDTLGIMTGIPTKNIYNIAMGIWKQVGGSGFEADAIVKGYSSNYLTSELKKAVEANHINKAKGYLNTLLATYKVGKTSSATQNELLSLYDAGFNALPKDFMTSYVDDNKSVGLSDAEVSAFRNYYEMGNNDADALIAISEYRTATQETRAKTLSKIYDTYHLFAKAKTLNYASADSRLANLLLYTNGNVNIAKYVIYLAKLGDIQENSKKSKKELTVDYINGLSSFNKQEKLLLMVLNGYSISEKLQNDLLSYLSAKGMNEQNAMTFLGIDR